MLLLLHLFPKFFSPRQNSISLIFINELKFFIKVAINYRLFFKLLVRIILLTQNRPFTHVLVSQASMNGW